MEIIDVDQDCDDVIMMIMVTMVMMMITVVMIIVIMIMVIGDLRWKEREHFKSWIEKKPMQIVDVGRQVEEQEEEGEHNYLQMMMMMIGIKRTMEIGDADDHDYIDNDTDR